MQQDVNKSPLLPSVMGIFNMRGMLRLLVSTNIDEYKQDHRRLPATANISRHNHQKDAEELQ